MRSGCENFTGASPPTFDFAGLGARFAGAAFAVGFFALDFLALDFFAVDFAAVDFLAVDLVGIGVSRTISRAGLSSRNPLNTACLTCPCAVKPRNTISATSL